MNLRRRSIVRSAGFTLIELLLVLVILGILAGIIVPKLIGRSEQAKQAAAKSDLSSLKTEIGMFEIDNGRLPTSEEGLQSLVTRPSGDLPNWKQLMDKIKMDPWGHAYIYRCPGTDGASFDVLSAGPDGQEGTADDIKP